MKIHKIYEDFYDKTLYLCVWDWDKFCVLLEKKWVDTNDWWNPLGMYLYVDWEGWYIWLKEKRLDYLLHELNHYIRDIMERIWYKMDDALHEYPSYAIEWYMKECCRILQLKNIQWRKKDEKRKVVN